MTHFLLLFIVFLLLFLVLFGGFLVWGLWEDRPTLTPEERAKYFD